MLNLEKLSICYRHFSDHHNLMIPITSVVEEVWNYILSTQGVEGGEGDYKYGRVKTYCLIE